MKILVISDIHGAFNTAYNIFLKEEPDMIIFAGDGLRDALELSYAADEKLGEFIMVKGNVDSDSRSAPLTKIIDTLGFQMMVTHGHLYGVKESMSDIERAAVLEKVDVVIFGHTHRQITYEQNGVRYFNPGAVKEGEYGVIRLIGEEILFEHKKI